ncbi:MAG: tetratricopeptide repeat protein [Spirochaetaceae bacterium]|nr:tetratricopeptide repeat protein [Spirochaetaceae bacterium]MCF7947471.1 tetratricopeptide repeat protein [Spirochaetia bacterium]MCF7950577.1 tetratricopeptide repeat protein [Spirochaetaceae bacterium]
MAVATCMLFVFGCAGDATTQEVDTDLRRDIQQRGVILQDVRSNITLGTPRSLDIALNTLYSFNLHNSEAGSELAFVANRLYHFVYPYLEYGAEPNRPPSGSIYPRLFEAVDQGRVPDISQEETTFLSSLASAVAVLTSSSPEQRERAGEVTSYMVQINPNSMLALYLHGYYLEFEGEYQEAQELYRRVLENDGSCYPARLGLVRIYYAQGNPEAALPHVEQLQLEFPEKRYVLQWAINVYLQAGDLDKADRLLSNAIIQFPDQTVFLQKRVQLLELQGKYEQAGRIAAVVEKRSGETPETLLVKVQSMIRNDRYEEALVLAERGMQEYPEFQRFSALYGELLIQLGRREAAFEHFQQRLEQDPKNLSIVSSLLDTAIELERWSAAEDYLEKLLEVRQTVSLLRKAVRVYDALDQPQTAVRYARSLSEEFPDDPIAVRTYLNQLLDSGYQQEAVEYVDRRVNEASQSEVRSVLLYFRARLVQDQSIKLQYLQSSLLENVQNVNALIEIAELYGSTGEYNKAIRYLRQAIALNPEDQTLRRKMRDLQNRTQ